MRKLLLLLVLLGATRASAGIPAEQDDCLGCHTDESQTFDLPSGEKLSLSVNQERFARSVHGESLRCIDCHSDKTSDHATGELKFKTRREVTKAYVGFDDKGTRMGVAVEAVEPGFADDVRLMVGFDPLTATLTGFSVLGQKETPGLGDKIEKNEAFGAGFRGKVAPIKGTKNATTGPSTVQTITGATISSRTVIQIINHAVALWQPRLLAFEKEGG